MSLPLFLNTIWTVFSSEKWVSRPEEDIAPDFAPLTFQQQCVLSCRWSNQDHTCWWNFWRWRAAFWLDEHTFVIHQRSGSRLTECTGQIFHWLPSNQRGCGRQSPIAMKRHSHCYTDVPETGQDTDQIINHHWLTRHHLQNSHLTYTLTLGSLWWKMDEWGLHGEWSSHPHPSSAWPSGARCTALALQPQLHYFPLDESSWGNNGQIPHREETINHSDNESYFTLTTLRSSRDWNLWSLVTPMRWYLRYSNGVWKKVQSVSINVPQLNVGKC